MITSSVVVSRDRFRLELGSMGHCRYGCDKNKKCNEIAVSQHLSALIFDCNLL